ACGLGESGIGLQIQDLMKESKNPTVGTLAATGDVRIRITAKADNPEEADRLIQEMEQEIRKRLGKLIYGVDDETLQENIVRHLEKLHLSVSLAEAFTGGLISQKLTGTRSPAFLQGIVLPSETSQRRFLDLSEEEFDSIRKDLRKMTGSFAERMKQETKSDLGLAVCGLISEDQTKGEFRVRICHSLATSEGMENEEHELGGEPPIVRERSAIIGLDLLRKYLLKADS
ncbi:MAG: hypothetical protein EHM36_09070, partial [Deltaproteobacteria bacterium]